ncbi:hypothetical protein LUZ60_017040 [Juncus effusus]|nr:hypothetical protein LUZ60_017040 [Juncus effusus]
MARGKRNDLLSISLVTNMILLFFYLASAFTDPLDVSAMEGLYGSLNQTHRLTGWKATGGDPCGKHWRGISCSDSSITSVNISGLGVGGTLGSELSFLVSLVHLDMSYNNISGHIPAGLPLNATFIDLSFNNFWGDLPSSFSLLPNLHTLYLQHNQFTGSVSFLANLPLSDLNIENNNFSGYVPKQFELISQLRIEGNQFEPYYLNRSNTSSLPPLPLPEDQNDSQTPKITQNVDVLPDQRPKSKRSRLAIGLMGAALGTIAVSLAISLAVYFLMWRPHNKKKEELELADSISMLSLPITAPPTGSGVSSMASIHSPFLCQIKPKRSQNRRGGRKSFSGRFRKMPFSKPFLAFDLCAATNNYSRDSLLGTGPTGSVFKALFSDGQVMAVKKMEMVHLELLEGDQEEFLDLVCTVSLLKHENICMLQGYCMDQAHYALVYDYARNGSLHDALFSKNREPLSWKLRLRIALGVASALEYMHEISSPAVAHGNLKASNVLLDEELMPRVTDCGLTALSHLFDITNNDKEIIEGSKGYVAPETRRGPSNSDKRKCDIFSFGVLLLELLTGLKAFDSKRRKEEQYLVQYASTRLHDLDCLQSIADQAMGPTIPPDCLSRFADIILLCIQPVPEFRLAMSEIGERLLRLIHKMGYHHKQQQHNCSNSRPGPSSHSASDAETDNAVPSFRTTRPYFDPPSSPYTSSYS